MPSAPVFRHAFCKKRCLKVLRQNNSQTLRHSQHDIHTTGKIRVKLERIAHCGKPDIGARIFHISAIHRIHQRSQPLRDHQLLKKSPQHPLHSPRYQPVIKPVRYEELLSMLPVFQDRPGKDDRKIHAVQHQLPVVSLRFCNTVVHVDHIAQQGKGIERHAQRDQKVNALDQRL